MEGRGRERRSLPYRTAVPVLEEMEENTTLSLPVHCMCLNRVLIQGRSICFMLSKVQSKYSVLHNRYTRLLWPVPARPSLTRHRWISLVPQVRCGGAGTDRTEPGNLHSEGWEEEQRVWTGACASSKIASTASLVSR